MIINLLRIIELFDQLSKIVFLDHTDEKFKKISLHLDEIMHKLDTIEFELKSKTTNKGN